MNSNVCLVPGYRLILATLVILTTGCQIPGSFQGPQRWQNSAKALLGKPVHSNDAYGTRPAQAGVQNRVDRQVLPAVWQDPETAQTQQRIESNPALAGDWYETGVTPVQGNIAPMRSSRPQAGQGRFHADAVMQSLPQTATERLIELSSEMTVVRQEMQRLTQSVQHLQNENEKLLHIRNELHARLAEMEQRLESSLQGEASARAQFDTLSQRVQLFSERRQRQITELNRIIDQLEVQLRQNESSNSASNQNPYRDSSGVRNDLR